MDLRTLGSVFNGILQDDPYLRIRRDNAIIDGFKDKKKSFCEIALGNFCIAVP